MTELPMLILGLLFIGLLLMTILMPVVVFLIWYNACGISETLKKMEHMMRHGK